jgi:predicted HTH transcriptional regulator
MLSHKGTQRGDQRKVAVADKTQEIRKLMQERLAELERERKALEEALRNLGGKARSTVRRGRGPGRPPGSTTTRRRRRKGGTRAEQAVKVVKANPGISAGDVAKELKIKPNYVYRVMSELVADKKVKKKGRGYYPA